MNSLKFYKSMTKNWPGGRRNATVIKDITPASKEDPNTYDNKPRPSSIRTWNTRIVNTKASWDATGNRTYLEPIPDTKQEEEE